jgi:hypothetical protein
MNQIGGFGKSYCRVQLESTIEVSCEIRTCGCGVDSVRYEVSFDPSSWATRPPYQQCKPLYLQQVRGIKLGRFGTMIGFSPPSRLLYLIRLLRLSS